MIKLADRSNGGNLTYDSFHVAKQIYRKNDKHIFLGSFKEQWRQVGNAVPPRLACTIAKAIKVKYYDAHSKK